MGRKTCTCRFYAALLLSSLEQSPFRRTNESGIRARESAEHAHLISSQNSSICASAAHAELTPVGKMATRVVAFCDTLLQLKFEEEIRTGPDYRVSCSPSILASSAPV